MRAAPFAALLALSTVACTDPDGDADAVPGAFSIVVIPDTQIYADRFPETLQRHGQWIVDHVDALDIRFVTHVGDIVNSGPSAEQWAAATAAFGPLQDLDIPHGFSPANHDVGSWGSWPTAVDTSCMRDPSETPQIDCDFTNYRAAFGPEHYTDRDWYVGSSPTGWSSAQRIEAEGLSWLFVHLPMDPPEAEVAWVESILDAHPDHLVSITTHRYLYDFRLTDDLPDPLNLFLGGRFNDAVHLVAGQPTFVDTVTAEALYERVIAGRPNVWSVHCGHVDGELRQQSVNSQGLPVHEMLTDYQNMADGGGGFLRVLTVIPEEERVEAWTVSTETGEMRENGDGFEHSLDIVQDYAGTAFGALASIGFDTAEFEALLMQLETDEALREQYRQSLYGEGRRDSQFLLDVPFRDYLPE